MLLTWFSTARPEIVSSADRPTVRPPSPGGCRRWLGGIPGSRERPRTCPALFAAILGISALLALLALALLTRRALRTRPVEAIGWGA
jgi:hypothetical protein